MVPKLSEAPIRVSACGEAAQVALDALDDARRRRWR
jgi:hypothetical protein